MTLKDVERKPFGLKGEFINNHQVRITYCNVGRVPLLDRLEKLGDWLGISAVPFDALKENILSSLRESEIQNDDEVLRHVADFVLNRLTDYNFDSYHGVGIILEGKDEKFPYLSAAFNLNLIPIPDEALESVEKLRKLEKELLSRSEKITVDLAVRSEDSLKVVAVSLAEVVSPGVGDVLRHELGTGLVEIVGIRAPYFTEKAKNFPAFEFKGIELPARRAIKIDKNGFVSWTEYSPLLVNRRELKRILLADLKEAKGKEEKIRAVEKFLDELKEALKDYYDRHPFNRETKIEGKLIEFLKEKVYLWTSEANEVGPAYTEPENFELVWEGKSLLDGETDLEIYRHREYPVYFVAGGEFGMGAPNFGAVIVEPTEEEVEMLKYLTFDQLSAVPSGASRIRKEGELFIIEAKYCSETGLETYRLNPDEIADMIALERGYGSSGPEM